VSKIIDIIVSPEIGFDNENLKNHLADQFNISAEKLKFNLLRRSVDGRSKQVKVNLKIEIVDKEENTTKNAIFPDYKKVDTAHEVHIIGAGPAGLFAALKLIELGIKPVIIERGKNVRDRRRDLAELNKNHIVNPDSNYCFGEGGAGTYSDGKLYTRSNKRGVIEDVLNTFFVHGAKPEIMIDTHPHIGTNKLPGIITAMRETIINAGGEIHFNKKLTDIVIEDQKIKAIKFQNGEAVQVKHVILATGHSARDIFELLAQRSVAIEFKPFALGLRIEHPQELIDSMQYHCDNRGEYLPAASYSFVAQAEGRGVYSFCMCPGGIIAPCATSPGEVVTNGWSPSKRNNPFANSGIVVEIKQADLGKYQYSGALMGVHFQSAIERLACKLAGGDQTAPAQRLTDFLEDKYSQDLPKSSYQPGVNSVELKELLPSFITDSLKSAFKTFGQKMKGYISEEALLHGVESRTSSPIRIPRKMDTFNHTEILNLYPCGEGAGYAGGIVSAAMDGQKVAVAIVNSLR